MPQKSVRSRVSAEEWETRVQLAACYRLSAHYGWTDLIYTHISARVPGPDEHFLLNPFGWMFYEITASNLIKVDIAGNIIGQTPPSIHKAGFLIHSAVHEARPDVACVIHSHTRAGMAVSMTKCGLLPLSQHAMLFHGRVAYHDSEGLALDMDEQARLATDLIRPNPALHPHPPPPAHHSRPKAVALAPGMCAGPGSPPRCAPGSCTPRHHR